MYSNRNKIKIFSHVLKSQKLLEQKAQICPFCVITDLDKTVDIKGFATKKEHIKFNKRRSIL